MAELDKLAGWERTRAVYRLYPLAMPLIWILIGVVIGAFLFGLNGDTGYITNIYTEILSISVTVFVLDYLNRQRDKESRIQDLKEQLVRDASSLVNDVAVNAVHQIRKRGWLKGDNGILKAGGLRFTHLAGAVFDDANLQGADLFSANLADVDLSGANLAGANLGNVKLKGALLFQVNLKETLLDGANLQGADLTGANLVGASLYDANLADAGLWNVNLQGVYLWNANLQDAHLNYANLQGVHLEHANLQGVHLEHAKFDETTTLPDETKWTPDTDMSRFTDPNHPDFWRSDVHNSPAYRGDNSDQPIPPGE